jgi:hypothetical protein
MNIERQHLIEIAHKIETTYNKICSELCEPAYGSLRKPDEDASDKLICSYIKSVWRDISKAVYHYEVNTSDQGIDNEGKYYYNVTEYTICLVCGGRNNTHKFGCNYQELNKRYGWLFKIL